MFNPFKLFRRKTKDVLVYDFNSERNEVVCTYQKIKYTTKSILALPNQVIDAVFRKDEHILPLSRPVDDMAYPDTSDFDAIKKTIEAMKDSNLFANYAAAEENIKEKMDLFQFILILAPFLLILIDLIQGVS